MQSKPKDSKDVLETSSLNIKTSMLNLEKMIKNENNHHSNGANNIMHRGPLAFDLSAADQRPARPSLAATSFQPFSVTNSTKTTNKLDVIDHEKYNKIKENANYLLINNERIKTSMNDFIDICELGSGTCGLVKKMQHKQTGQLIAVKQMRIAGNAEENKRIIMDLDVVLKCHNCENIVSCLGYFISDSDVWICMDLMTMCFEKLLKITGSVPEKILGKLTLSTLKALDYLKETHNVIHRDIKPSNLLSK
jgi:mitogen-activated protein kinase kinase 7